MIQMFITFTFSNLAKAFSYNYDEEHNLSSNLVKQYHNPGRNTHSHRKRRWDAQRSVGKYVEWPQLGSWTSWHKKADASQTLGCIGGRMLRWAEWISREHDGDSNSTALCSRSSLLWPRTKEPYFPQHPVLMLSPKCCSCRLSVMISNTPTSKMFSKIAAFHQGMLQINGLQNTTKVWKNVKAQRPHCKTASQTKAEGAVMF